MHGRAVWVVYYCGWKLRIGQIIVSGGIREWRQPLVAWWLPNADSGDDRSAQQKEGCDYENGSANFSTGHWRNPGLLNEQIVPFVQSDSVVESLVTIQSMSKFALRDTLEIISSAPISKSEDMNMSSGDLLS